MKQILSAASDVQSFFEQQNWDFCFIGGLALLAWAQPRLTNDADVVVFSGFGNEPRYIETILSRYKARVPDPAEFARKTRVLLLELDGVGIDVSLGALPFELSVVERSFKFEFLEGYELRVCSAEDLIVLKAFADRLKDWADIESILVARPVIDWAYVNDQLRPLVELKEEPGILTKLADLKSRFDNEPNIHKRT